MEDTSKGKWKTHTWRVQRRQPLHLPVLEEVGEGELPQRPRTRADCIDGPRPCPWVGCRHHLYLEVKPSTGNIQYNFPALEPDELEASCALDVVDELGPATYTEIGKRLNVTKTRIEQLIHLAVFSLRKALAKAEIDL